MPEIPLQAPESHAQPFQGLVRLYDGTDPITRLPPGWKSPPSSRLSFPAWIFDQSERPPSGGELENSFSTPHNRHTPGLVAPLAASMIQWWTWDNVNSDLLIPLRL